MFRKKSHVKPEVEFVDAVKYQFSDRPDFSRNSMTVLIDEYFIPSLRIAFNNIAEFRCDKARNVDVDYGYSRHSKKVKTVNPLEKVKLPKELVDKIEMAVKAREALESAQEKLVSSTEYKELFNRPRLLNTQ